MAFSSNLLTFLRENKEHFGYYIQCDEFALSNEITSNFEESIYIIRAGDEYEVNWFPDAKELSSVNLKLDHEDPLLLVIVWTRIVGSGSEKALNDMYNVVQTIPSFAYVFARQHPNGLYSVEFMLHKGVQDNNYTFIVSNVDKL